MSPPADIEGESATQASTVDAGETAASKNSRRLARVLAHHAVTHVLDIGAHRGEYAKRLRRAGYHGRITSFEPQSAAHGELSAAVADDPAWTVAPRMALGDSEVPVTLNVSAETDMTSVLDFSAPMAELLTSAAYVGTEVASQQRLDAVFAKHVAAGEAVMVKIDTQGTEARVLDGAAGVLSRVTLIQIEMSIVPVYAGEPDYLTMIARLARTGFHPVLFIPGYFNQRTARLIGLDGVFARV